MPWYAVRERVEMRGAVWRHELAAWAASDTAAGEITLDPTGAAYAAYSAGDSGEFLEPPTLRLRTPR